MTIKLFFDLLYGGKDESSRGRNSWFYFVLFLSRNTSQGF